MMSHQEVFKHEVPTRLPITLARAGKVHTVARHETPVDQVVQKDWHVNMTDTLAVHHARETLDST